MHSCTLVWTVLCACVAYVGMLYACTHLCMSIYARSLYHSVVYMREHWRRLVKIYWVCKPKYWGENVVKLTNAWAIPGHEPPSLRLCAWARAWLCLPCRIADLCHRWWVLGGLTSCTISVNMTVQTQRCFLKESRVLFSGRSHFRLLSYIAPLKQSYMYTHRHTSRQTHVHRYTHRCTDTHRARRSVRDIDLIKSDDVTARGVTSFPWALVQGSRMGPCFTFIYLSHVFLQYSQKLLSWTSCMDFS